MSNVTEIIENIRALEQENAALSQQLQEAQLATVNAQQGIDPLIFGLTVLVLACFVGYYVVWRVTPSLHTPLMAVTNAISGIIIVGAMIALGAQTGAISGALAFIATMIAAINIFGGFVVTQRMLAMFKKKKA